MAVALNESVSERVRRIFAPELHAQVVNLLVYECADNLPFHENSDAKGLERVRLDVLELSAGDYEKLRQWVELAKLDWRDVVVAAEYTKRPDGD